VSTTTDPTDPLGRLDAHASSPYDHPEVTQQAIEASWRRHYATEAAALDDGTAAVASDRAVADLAACEAAIERAWLIHGRIDLALYTRKARLVGRRDALVTDLARRRAS
jgi:hypothetical protein